MPELTFCEQLQLATGPDSAELTFDPLDPDRLESTVGDLEKLRELAPAEIAPTLDVILDVFETARTTPRDDVAAALAEREDEIATAAQEFAEYGLLECGAILVRAEPTPTVIALQGSSDSG